MIYLYRYLYMCSIYKNMSIYGYREIYFGKQQDNVYDFGESNFIIVTVLFKY